MRFLSLSLLAFGAAGVLAAPTNEATDSLAINNAAHFLQHAHANPPTNALMDKCGKAWGACIKAKKDPPLKCSCDSAVCAKNKNAKLKEMCATAKANGWKLPTKSTGSTKPPQEE